MGSVEEMHNLQRHDSSKIARDRWNEEGSVCNAGIRKLKLSLRDVPMHPKFKA
jgi:hypothetical protein